MIPKESYPDIESQYRALFHDTSVSFLDDKTTQSLSPALASIDHNRPPLTSCHTRSDGEKHLNDTKHKQSQNDRSHQRLPSPCNGVLDELHHSSNPEGPNPFKFQQLYSTGAIHSCTSGGSNATMISAWHSQPINM